MVQLYCGNGKGKTTASIGGAIRARGTGKEVIFAQFMKGNQTGELSILEKIEGIQILRSEKDFGFYRQLTEEEKKEMKSIHNTILETIEKQVAEIANTKKEYFIVLDEITYADQWELVNREKLFALLAKAKNQTDVLELVITGSNPSPEIVEYADYISEITAKRHPFEKGIRARKGIEY